MEQKQSAELIIKSETIDCNTGRRVSDLYDPQTHQTIRRDEMLLSPIKGCPSPPGIYKPPAWLLNILFWSDPIMFLILIGLMIWFNRRVRKLKTRLDTVVEIVGSRDSSGV